MADSTTDTCLFVSPEAVILVTQMFGCDCSDLISPYANIVHWLSDSYGSKLAPPLISGCVEVSSYRGLLGFLCSPRARPDGHK